MDEDHQGAPQAPGALLPIRDPYPNESIPTIFSDGVSSAQNGIEVVRFYLSRFDPNTSGSGPMQNEPVAQVIMPVSGFVQTVNFLSKMLSRLEESGTVAPETKARILGQKGD